MDQRFVTVHRLAHSLYQDFIEKLIITVRLMQLKFSFNYVYLVSFLVEIIPFNSNIIYATLKLGYETETSN